MFLKTLKISIPIILVFIIIAIGYNSYQRAVKNTENPLNVIPSNAAVILQINDVEKVHTNLNDVLIWNRLRNISLVDSVNTQIKNLSSFYNTHHTLFKNSALFISFHKVGANNNAVLLSGNFLKNEINDESAITRLFGGIINEVQYNNQSIFELNNKSEVIFMSFKEDIVFCSTNKMLVEDAIRASTSTENLTTLPSFANAYKTISETADINLIYNYNKLFEYTNLFCNSNINISDFSSWVATDISLKNELIVANGFGTFNKNTNDFTDVFNNQSPQKIGITDIIPENTSLLLAIGFNNTKDLYEKKNKILQNQNNFWSWDKHRKAIIDSNNVNYNEFINELEKEAGLFNTSATQSQQQQYTYFKSKNSITTSSLLQGLITDKKTYSDYAINTIADPKITAHLFGDLFEQSTPYFTSINDYFIFSNTVASLEYLIDNYKGKNTLVNSKHFSNYSNYFSSKSNLFFYINPGKTASALKNKLQANFSKQLVFNTDSLAKFTALSLQITAKKNLLLNNLNLFYDTDFKEDIKEEWFKQLDTTTSMTPQFVYNHFTKEQMILIQNDNNTLFAINAKGEQLWKKELDAKIIGEISVIDAYKNNKYQCLFNTNSQLHLLDRNGKNVDGFPKILPSKTSLGHSLFDYNNTKKYRIIIVGNDNNIYNLDKKGKDVKGWKYEVTTDNIKESPRHFRVGTKDYILAATQNSNTRLLALNGSERVSFETNIQFTNNPTQIDNNGTLYNITTEGKLWKGTTNGNATTITVPNLSSNSKLLHTQLVFNNTETSNSQLAYTNNNQLFIIDTKEFNNLQSFTLNSEIIALSAMTNNIYATTTKQHLYLFNSSGIIEGFPIATDGYFNMVDLNNNSKINILNVKNGFIYSYELGSKK